MSYKNVTQVLSNKLSRGKYDHQVLDINFAVPSFGMIRKHSLNEDEDTHPRRIYSDAMQTEADNIKSTSTCLSYDMKKIKTRHFFRFW